MVIGVSSATHKEPACAIESAAGCFVDALDDAASFAAAL
jgi:hypothetical protein